MSRRRGRYRQQGHTLRSLSCAQRKKLQFAIADRDNWICCFCNKEVIREEWSFDHIIPQCVGGRAEYGNLRLAHKTCNDRDALRIQRKIERGDYNFRLPDDRCTSNHDSNNRDT